MNILFSHAPFYNNRFANNLIWMARSFPALQETNSSFFFPWGSENFSGFLHHDSPWLAPPSAELISLFERAAAVHLNSVSLSDFVTACEARALNCDSQAGAKNNSLMVSIEINGVCVRVARGNAVSFSSLIKHGDSNQLTIVHEPFDITYESDRFPSEGISHLHPRESILNDIIERFSIDSTSSKIALHIRRGDYSRWMNGRYYFNDEFWIDAYTKLYSENCDVYIVTNDYGDPLVAKLEEMGAIISRGSFVQDFALLMMMNKIYGPPSTFPLMAKNLAKSCRSVDINYIQFQSEADLVQL